MEGVDTGLAISTSVVLTICILGLVGNAVCIWVLFQREMKTSYNFLLIGLSFCDFFLLVLSVIRTLSNLPLYKIDYDNPWMSYPIFIWDFICTGGTKYYTVAISLERCFAICFPIAAHGYMTESRARWLAVGVFLFTLFVTFVSYLYRFHWDATSFDVFVAVVLHFAPFLAVLVLNLCIYAGLKMYRKKRKTLTETESSEVSVTRMLLVIVVVFGLCYSFEFVRRILNFTGYFSDPNLKYYDYTLNHLADIFYVLNSSVNFIIYYLMGNAFRGQFLKLMKTSCGFARLREGAACSKFSEASKSALLKISSSHQKNESQTSTCID